MGKLFAFLMTTLDGAMEGPDGDVAWHRTDEEFNEFSLAQLRSVDTIVFGRRTYELMAGYWSTTTDDPEVAALMNATPKVVFSRTLATADWAHTNVLRDAAADMPRLKAETAGDLAIFGSSGLCASLLDAGLIDEIRLIVNPIVLGGGTPVFGGIAGTLALNLRDVRTFANGNVLLTYTPAAEMAL